MGYIKYSHISFTLFTPRMKYALNCRVNTSIPNHNPFQNIRYNPTSNSANPIQKPIINSVVTGSGKCSSSIRSHHPFPNIRYIAVLDKNPSTTPIRKHSATATSSYSIPNHHRYEPHANQKDHTAYDQVQPLIVYFAFYVHSLSPYMLSCTQPA